MGSNSLIQSSGIGEITTSEWERSHALDVFSPAVSEKLYYRGHEYHFQPVTSLSGETNEIRIMVPPFTDQMVDLKDTRLVIKAKIMERDQTGQLKNLAAGADVSTCNLLGAALFSKACDNR